MPHGHQTPHRDAEAAALRPAQHCLRLRASVLPGEGRTHGLSSFGSSSRGRQARRSRPQVPDEPIVATWRDCVGRALQNYGQSHDLHALQVAAGSCQVRLEEQGGASFTADAGPPVPQAVPPQMDGRRNIGCGWWPIGSDADRDCAAGGRPF
jgi:hypothetical protein